MRLICTKKDNGKRLLVDPIEEPNYKELYNDEDGKCFGAVEVKAPEVIPEGMVELTPELAEELIEDYQCGNCDKKYKTLKGIEKHLKKCK